MKIVFMGTPEFAVPSLDMLVREGYTVAAVVTQTDKPKGRGNKLAAPPVKEYAVKNGIKVLQPFSLKPSKPEGEEFIRQLREIAPDLLITVAYGKILPREVLDTPPLGCINVHGSLLPKYRGAAPIQWSVINGETITGITTMYTDVGLDTGDMLLKREIIISEDMTAGELHDQMTLLGAEVLKDTLAELKKGTLKRIPQNHDQATMVSLISKETGKIDWSIRAEEVHNLVRGANPWPGAYTFYRGERLRIWKTKALPCPGNENEKPGTILMVDKDGITVVCGLDCVIIRELQFDSGKKMSVAEYLCGHTFDKGEVLG